MEVVTEYLAGGTIWVRAYVYDKDGNLVDPTSITLILVDHDGETKVDNLAMDKDSTGVYDYYYNTSSDSSEGWWNGEVWTTDGSGETAKKSWCEFSVEVRKGL